MVDGRADSVSSDESSRARFRRRSQAVGRAGRRISLPTSFCATWAGSPRSIPRTWSFTIRSKFLPPGRDLFGEVLKEAHARKIRVIGRFDLSKTEKPVYDAHPEWFFVRTNGQPHVFNGLYSACINGAYYREHGIKILTEALERYAVDGLFFNMFGNPSTDYGGNPMGPCQCDQCKARFEKRFGRTLPTTLNDPDYRAFMRDSSSEVAGMFAELIHRLRPGAGFFTYIDEQTDGIMSESNTAVGRALPLWPYSASDNVNRALNSEPDEDELQPVHELCRLLLAVRDGAAGGNPAAAAPEPGARRAAGAGRAGDDGPGGSPIAHRRKIHFRVAREAPGAVRRPAQRGPRAAADRGSAELPIGGFSAC